MYGVVNKDFMKINIWWRSAQPDTTDEPPWKMDYNKILWISEQ